MINNGDNNFANPIRIQDLIINRFAENCLLANVLQESRSRCYMQTEVLTIPAITSEDVVFDPKTNCVEIFLNEFPDDASSATSINRSMKTRYSTEELRTFIHDFTFAIVTDTTDQRFDRFFPQEHDQYDNRTPDLFVIRDDACLLLEFSTSRNDNEHYLQRAYDTKEFAYLDAFRRRITSANNRGIVKKYGFSPIVVSATRCMISTDIQIPRALINELCARFRFAVNVIRAITEHGVELEETSFDQIRADLRAQLDHIKPVWQSEGDVKIPLSKERILTNDVKSSDALKFAKKVYVDLLKDNLKQVPRNLNETNGCWVWSKLIGKNLGNRLDKRSVLQLPSWLPEPNYGPPQMPNQMFSSTEYGDMWDEAIDHMRTIEWSNEMSHEELIDMALKPGDLTSETETNKARRRYKRVKIRLSDSQRVEFGKVGMQGKQVRDDLKVQDYRVRQKEPFSLNVYTDDIDHFLLDKSLLEQRRPAMNHINRVSSIIDHALNNHEASHKPGSQMLSRIESDKLFQWTTFISDLGSELCISIKQNVGHDEFVLKALKNWNAFLLIKPTNSDSHIFYSILIPNSSKGALKVLPGNIGKTALEIGDNLIFPWMSYSVSKLVNCIKAESFFITMLSQWSRYYEMDSFTGAADINVRRMLNLTLLIHLEDKPKTEEILTLFRYISMEKFSLVTPNNQKMLEKIPNVVRSRLQVWVIKKLVNVMIAPNYEPSIDDVIEGSGTTKERRWLNMVNPYTNEAITHPQKLIELYYLGYCTNKDAKSWPNSEFDLVKKIVKYEMELDNVRPEFCGMKELPNGKYRVHEWSRIMNCAGADSIKRLLTAMYSDQYEAQLEEKILTRLSRLTWEQVATLKASSTFNPNERKERDVSGKHRTQRIKVLIAVLRHKGELEDTPAKSLSKVLDWIDKDGGLRVDIFKKNQHGGLREIYVLEIHSRILQLCLEEISRAICSEIPIEMMTHSQNKISKAQEHMYAAAIEKCAYKVNISSSNDAKVWNQGHHVAKFCQFMCRLLPERWHGVMVNGLKQWTTRKIGLPDGVLDLMKQFEIPPLADEVHAEIRSAYLGLTNRTWLKQGEEFLRIESGMMQGILHYMSSAYHCGLLLLRDSLWKSIMKHKGVRSRTLDLVSSDDSSRMTDVFTDSAKLLKHAKLVARSDHLLIKDLSPYFGIFMSEKSTYCSNGVMEFNSEFFFRASLYRPTLKWAYASLNVVEVESLVERQEVMYNLITQLLEAGSGFRQAHETQVAQAVLHYRLLGCSVNPLFADYCTQLMQVQDPALGYFFLDHPLCAGLPGFQYNVWKALTNNALLSSLYASLLACGDLTTTTSGQIVRSCQVRFGNRQKAIRLVEEAEKVMPDWRDKVEQTPAVLYQVARDLETATMKILVKLTSPSVIRSLAKGNSVARMLASSVYLINGLATSIGSNWNHILEEKMGRPVKKVSLWYLLQQSLLHTRPLTQEEMLVLYPLRDYYSSITNLLKTLDKYALVPGGTRKMLRSHVVVYPDPPSLPFNLEEMVRWKWFGEDLPASRTTVQQVWEIYSQTYTWLRATPQESLEAAHEHFETHIQMRNFIARQVTKARKVHLTGAPIRDSGTQDLLYSAITRNQMIMKVLVPPCSNARPDLTQGDSTLSAIAGLLSFPLKTETKVDLIVRELRDSPDLWNGGVIRPSNRKTRLGVIQHYIKKTDNGRLCSVSGELAFNKILKDSRLGVVGGFVKRQTYCDKGKDWSGEGVWSGMIGEAAVKLNIKDSLLVSVATNSIEKLRESQILLRNLCHEFGVTLFAENVLANVSLSGVYFDLRQLRADRVGAPVIENRIMRYNEKVSLSSLKLMITEDTLRLVQKLRNGICYTLVAYRSMASDFKFNKPVKSHLQITSAWLNNLSLDKVYAKTMLLKGMTESISNNIDLTAFSTFVRNTLMPALYRTGLNLNVTRMGLEAGITQELDLSEILLRGEDEDPLGDFDDDDFSFMKTLEEDVESDSSDLEFEAIDLVMGEVSLFESNRELTPIHHVHKIWDNYCLDIMSTLSRSDINSIERGYLPRGGESDLTRILKHYMGLEFSSYEDKQPQPRDLLQTLEEEF